MLLIKFCRECRKYKIIRNDETGKDKHAYNQYIKNKMVCKCKNGN